MVSEGNMSQKEISFTPTQGVMKNMCGGSRIIKKNDRIWLMLLVSSRRKRYVPVSQAAAGGHLAIKHGITVIR